MIRMSLGALLLYASDTFESPGMRIVAKRTFQLGACSKRRVVPRSAPRELYVVVTNYCFGQFVLVTQNIRSFLVGY